MGRFPRIIGFIVLIVTLLLAGDLYAQHARSLGIDAEAMKSELLRQNAEAGRPFTEMEITAFHDFMTADATAQARQTPSIDVGFYDSPGMATDRSIPLGSRIPLILVHGSGSDLISDGSLNRPLNDQERWINYLADFNDDPAFYNAYKVYRFVYDSRISIVENGYNLVNVIDRIHTYAGWEGESLDGHSLVVLAHSMGGLVARTAMNIAFEEGIDAGVPMGESVINALTLGTPHRGSPLAVPAWVYDSVLRDSGITALEYDFSYVLHWAFDPYVGQFDLAWDNYDNAVPLDDIVTYAEIFIPKMIEVGGGLDQHVESIIAPYTGLLNTGDLYQDRLYLYSGTNPPFDNLDSLLDLVFYYTFGLLNEHHMLGFSCNKMGQVIAGDLGEGDAKPYSDNDGLVPAVSALFASQAVPFTRTFDDCDHLTLMDGGAVIDAVRAELVTIASGRALAATVGPVK